MRRECSSRTVTWGVSAYLDDDVLEPLVVLVRVPVHNQRYDASVQRCVLQHARTLHLARARNSSVVDLMAWCLFACSLRLRTRAQGPSLSTSAARRRPCGSPAVHSLHRWTVGLARIGCRIAWRQLHRKPRASCLQCCSHTRGEICMCCMHCMCTAHTTPHSAAQCSAKQRSAKQRSAAQRSAAQRSAAQCSAPAVAQLSGGAVADSKPTGGYRLAVGLVRDGEVQHRRRRARADLRVRHFVVPAVPDGRV